MIPINHSPKPQPRHVDEIPFIQFGREYHARCAEFDTVVLTGPVVNGERTPANEHQRKLIVHYIAKFKADCDALPNRLQLILHKLGVSEDDAAQCDRVKTAKAARAFFDAVEGQEPTPMVKAIANAQIETSGKALGRSIKSAATVLASLLEPTGTTF